MSKLSGLLDDLEAPEQIAEDAQDRAVVAQRFREVFEAVRSARNLREEIVQDGWSARRKYPHPAHELAIIVASATATEQWREKHLLENHRKQLIRMPTEIFQGEETDVRAAIYLMNLVFATIEHEWVQRRLTKPQRERNAVNLSIATTERRVEPQEVARELAVILAQAVDEERQSCGADAYKVMGNKRLRLRQAPRHQEAA